MKKSFDGNSFMGGNIRTECRLLVKDQSPDSSSSLISK